MSYDQAVAVRQQSLGSSSGGSKSSLVVYDDKFNRIITGDAHLKRKRRRFSPVDEKQYSPPPFLDLPIGLSVSDVDQFFREQRLDEVTAKMSRNDWELGDPDIRPPSPPPAYDKHGSRTNSREIRVKTSMQKEYHRLVASMLKRLAGYVAPTDFKPPKITMRVEIPQERYPDINFTGMILGPRGLNHKRLEEETGCQISIRGKGTRGQLESQTEEELAMPLHVCISGEDEDKVSSAVRQIAPLVDPLHPEFEGERTRGLEQLALLTGTGQAFQQRQLALLEADGIEEFSYTKIDVRCSVCGDRGHLGSDCPNRKTESKLEEWRIDNEYNQLISELGGRAPRPDTLGMPPPPLNSNVRPSSHPLAMQSIPSGPPPPIRKAVMPPRMPGMHGMPAVRPPPASTTGSVFIPPMGFPPGFQPPPPK